jgi:hypothetical protein
MILAQFFSRQGRAKIPVPLADDRQNRSPQRLGLAPVAATPRCFEIKPVGPAVRYAFNT